MRRRCIALWFVGLYSSRTQCKPGHQSCGGLSTFLQQGLERRQIWFDVLWKLGFIGFYTVLMYWTNLKWLFLIVVAEYKVILQNTFAKWPFFPLDTHQTKERNSPSQVLYVQICPWLGKIVGSFHVCLFVLRRPMKVWRSMSLPMLQLPHTVSFSMSYVMSTWNSWNLVFMAKALMSKSWKIVMWHDIFCMFASIGPWGWCILDWVWWFAEWKNGDVPAQEIRSNW